MRRLFQTGITLIVYLLCGAPSCNDNEQGSTDRKQTVLTSAIDSIRESFGTDNLSTAALEAFELSASEKLSDFEDYLHLLGDTTLNLSFKEKAKEMIRALFISDNVRFLVLKNANTKEEELTLEQLLTAGEEQKVQCNNLIFDSIRVKQHFQRTDDTTYSGTLNFTLRYKGVPLSGKGITVIAGKPMDIFILKRKKIFGNVSLSVWMVFLGDLKEPR